LYQLTSVNNLNLTENRCIHTTSCRHKGAAFCHVFYCWVWFDCHYKYWLFI